MKTIFTFLVALILLTNCKVNNESDVYIGSYRVMDQLIPYPYIIQQRKNVVYLFNNNGSILDKIDSGGAIKNKSDLKFKEKHLQIFNKKENSFFAFDLLDTINFKLFKNQTPNIKYSAKFEKVFPAKKLDILKIKNEIGNHIWNYKVVADENSNPNNDLEIEQLLQFESDSLKIITNYYYKGLKTVSEYETKAFHIFEIGNIYFLSFQKENDNPQVIYQITGYNPESIELKDFSSKEIKDIRYYKDSMSNEDFNELIKSTTNYSNCFDGYQGEYYFGHEDVTFSKGNEYIIDFVNIDAPKVDTESGYIIVHFTINCNGAVGKFGLIQMDRAFKQTVFSAEMVDHILHKVKSLKDFPSTYSQLDWVAYKDVHAFLMFKIEKGKIIDLCP